MFCLLVGCLFLGLLVYVAWRAERTEGLVTKLVAKRVEAEEAKPQRQSAPISFLPDEWTDVPWTWKSNEEERRALENPNALHNPDEFLRGQILQRFNSLTDAFDRISFLRALRSRNAYFDEVTTGAILKDHSPMVRSWAAANLDLEFRDYRNHTFGEGEAPLLADYTDDVLNDHDPVVAASLWTNPEFKRLPWSMIWLSQSWKEEFKGMTPMARLALMHNRKLWPKYVVALMSADSDELGISRDEHAQLLFTASNNTHLVLDSRHHGRDYWVFEGDPNPPDETYGQMWEIAVDKWMDRMHVPYSIMRYIQTTGEVKLGVYQKLLDPSDNHKKQFRETIIESCDVFRDKEVLKVAWSDHDEECRSAAREVTGNLQSIVGVKGE
jgi:hypothetical protein